MVTPRPKPDSSYASNRLTRENFCGRSLLSTFQDREAPEPVTKPEPATDDEPVSSSEEEEETKSNTSVNDDFREHSTPRRSGPTLGEKLANASRGNGTPARTPRSRRGIESPRAQRSGRKRTLKETVPDKDGNDHDDPFSECGWSSQPMKRHRTDYGSKKKRHSEVFSRKSSTPLQTNSPSSSRRRPKSADNSPNAERQSKSTDTESQNDDGFKVPREINIKRSPSKSRSSPEFKVPPLLPNDIVSSSSFAPSSAREPAIFDTDDDDDSPLSSPLSELSETGLQDILSGDAGDGPKPSESLCPWCKEPVDPELLLRFQSQPKQRIREQQRFCDSHKKSAAEKEWNDKGYPAIDWDTFDNRISGYFNDLESLLVPDSQSYYRNILDSTLKAGKAKNFRLTLEGDGLETISCGYYGTRGSNKMLQALTRRFSRKLRRLAASDHIVKSAGVVGYAQAVLVPELAVRLVKEDMEVSDEVARQILRDSIDIGEKLNFALNDEVPIPEEVAAPSVDG
ncbi:RTC4-like domain-containing protein [Aspergillus bertholletiae]|uniref:Restriction of telomere capping protein 4 n=1 Tax=Aspergillus bertholletiae TaxID=1226010 RepID=A0A5N7APL7_9EURO|nr:RTC4-like domain-containing protein [Aspergillus bertholletiae]